VEKEHGALLDPLTQAEEQPGQREERDGQQQEHDIAHDGPPLGDARAVARLTSYEGEPSQGGAQDSLKNRARGEAGG